MQKTFKKIFLIIILSISIGIFMVRNESLLMRNNPFSEYKCYIPVTYAVGTVDPRFGVSQEKFVSLMQEAEQKWETALGRDVFQMENDGRVKVNLVYDERQLTTENLKNIMLDVDNNKEKADQLVANYESLRAQLEEKNKIFETQTSRYNQDIKDYTNALEKYQSDLKEYEKEVAYWNSQGGAPKEVFIELTEQKKDLDAQVKDLKKQESALNALRTVLEKKQQELNDMVAQVNGTIGAVNQTATKANSEIADYNETQAARGEFETGLYMNDNGQESIDIFQFFDDEDLLAVLIHEMGHALGLAHAENPTAIMYPKLINQSAEITPDDIAFFQTTCVR
jgi:predicted Zn-dependent protease